MISQPLFNEILPIHFDRVIRTKEEFLEATKSNSRGPYLIDGKIEFTKASEIGELSGSKGYSGTGKSLLVFSERAKIIINISEQTPFSQTNLFSNFNRIYSFYPIDSTNAFSQGVVEITELHPQVGFSVFSNCQNIYGVSVTFSYVGHSFDQTYSENIVGFNKCAHLTDCFGCRYTTKDSIIFKECKYLSNCVILDSASNAGFVDCVQVGLSCAQYNNIDYSKGEMKNCITYVQKGLTLKVYGGLEQN